MAGRVPGQKNLKLGVIKYEPRLFFQNLYDSCTSERALYPSLRSKLFLKSSPNLNERTHEKSESTHTLLQELQIPKKCRRLILNNVPENYGKMTFKLN